MAATDRPFSVHLTNLAGAGAVQLAASLLPALERAPGYRLEQVHLPDRGALAGYRRSSDGPSPVRYRRRLPNALSRVLECVWLSRRFDGATPMLVLGDLPLRCTTRQVVFVQTQHLVQGDRSGNRWAALKYRIARALFAANARFGDAYIVQTDTMKAALELTYPAVKGKVRVIPQPAPDWLLASGLRRRTRRSDAGPALKLFYPAAAYPHKNHALLGRATPQMAAWPVESLLLTVAPDANPNPRLDWIRCVGMLSSDAMLAAYADIDALLFLSIAESYGFPLVEAMWIGLPIVCPDLPYARSLCGDQAFYFDPTRIESLQRALQELQQRLQAGWWPDWSARLIGLPRDWDAVAAAMLEAVFAAPDEATKAPVRAEPGPQRNENA
jgi:glycosyltransferase involved in cell wall biosynthesis